MLNFTSVDLAQIATGEAWYGQRAVALNLIDRIETSDLFLQLADLVLKWIDKNVKYKKPGKDEHADNDHDHDGGYHHH